MNNRGFTLIEMLIAVAVIGILAAIAYPSYQNYIIRTKRTDAMSYLQSQASQLESQKLTLGSYDNIPTANLPTGNYPQGGTALYTVATNMDVNDDNIKGDWQITATPVSTAQMKDDGALSINANGTKCRDTKCGMGEEWKD